VRETRSVHPGDPCFVRSGGALARSRPSRPRSPMSAAAARRRRPTSPRRRDRMRIRCFLAHDVLARALRVAAGDRSTGARTPRRRPARRPRSRPPARPGSDPAGSKAPSPERGPGAAELVQPTHPRQGRARVRAWPVHPRGRSAVGRSGGARSPPASAQAWPRSLDPWLLPSLGARGRPGSSPVGRGTAVVRDEGSVARAAALAARGADHLLVQPLVLSGAAPPCLASSVRSPAASRATSTRFFPHAGGAVGCRPALGHVCSSRITAHPEIRRQASRGHIRLRPRNTGRATQRPPPPRRVMPVVS
jgi:hypothetical protein